MYIDVDFLRRMKNLHMLDPVVYVSTCVKSLIYF
jgi:hypothetical protein